MERDEDRTGSDSGLFGGQDVMQQSWRGMKKEQGLTQYRLEDRM